jgi:glutathione synthase/RimK-type ligase-like ATP-grasp enzyme
MRLLLITTTEDLSADRICEEANKKRLGVSKFLYSDLSSTLLNEINFSEYDFCILRDPYNTGEDFSVYVHLIARSFPRSKILDPSTLIKYPYYEDKLFQHLLFQNKVKMLKFLHYNSIDKIDFKKIDFPVIAKKRISSRGRELFLIKNKNQFKEFFNTHKIIDYLFEEYKKIKKDLRVFILNNKIIACVERNVRIKNEQGYTSISVKVKTRTNVLSDIKNKAIDISRIIGCDFCGLDFIIDGRGDYYFLECNISPQFVASERILGKNIAEKLVEYVIKRIKT